MEVQTYILYRSNEQFHVRFINGERKEEPYYLYYMFRPDGVWLSKTTDYPALEAEDFMVDIDLAAVGADPDHDEPLDTNRELRYQCGTYECKNDTVYINWKHSQLEGEKRQWYFRIRESGLLETDFQEVQLWPQEKEA
ncbi:MAG: hypothetical protein AAF570_15690 [Bacteroidota bacterium]